MRQVIRETKNEKNITGIMMILIGVCLIQQSRIKNVYKVDVKVTEEYSR